MPNKCLYPSCKTRKTNDGKLKSIFCFPRDNELLEKWKSLIPLEFGDLDLSNKFLCEDHFDGSDMTVKNRYKKLLPHALPKYFEKLFAEDIEKFKEEKQKFIVRLPGHDNNCRFCLKKFDPSEKKTTICTKIRKLFAVLTDSELRMSSVYSSNLCQNCCKELTSSCSFKRTITSNQAKLYKTFESIEFITEEPKNHSQFESLNLDTKNTQTEFSDSLSDDIKEEEIDFENFEIKTDHSLEDLLEDGFNGESVRKSAVVKKETYLEKRLKYLKEKVLCVHCGITLTRGSIKKHIKRAHHKNSEAAIVCDLCGREFFIKQRLVDHMKVHIGIKTYKCTFNDCNESFLSRGGLYAHKSIKHLGKYIIYCELCGKKYTAKANYETHVRSVHTGERPFLCDVPNCGKQYFSKTMLQSHKKYLHSGSVKCPECLKEYASGDCLRKHMKVHSDTRFTCNFQMCGKQFVTKYFLKLHMKGHTGEKDYGCSHCGARYMKKANLKKHFLSVHMKLRINCEIQGCRSNFTRKEIYRKHVLSHHQNIGKEAIDELLLKIRHMQLPKPDLERRDSTE